MSFPIGVNTVTLTIGTTLAGDGESGSFDGVVVPIFGGTVRAILWLVNGTSYTDVSGTVVSGPSGVAAVAVPDPHQDGWVVPTLGPGGATMNVPITDWGYFVSGIVTFASGKKRIIGKAVKIPPGQTAVDLDTVADGQIVGGVQGPYQSAISDVEITTLLPGTDATVALTDGVLQLGIPRGAQGVSGPPGPSGVVVLDADDPDPDPPLAGVLYVRLGEPAPAVPTGLAASLITDDGFTLSWSASVGATGYEARLNGGSATAATSPNAFTGLDPNTLYAAQVRARNASGVWSGWSTALDVTTDATPSGPSLIFADTFNRADGPAGNGWEGPSGDGSNTTIASNALALSGWGAYNRVWQPGLPQLVSVRALFVSTADWYQGIFLARHPVSGGGIKLFRNGADWVLGNADSFSGENTIIAGTPPAGATALRLDFDGTNVRAWAGVGTPSTLVADVTLASLGITGLSSDPGTVYLAGYCGEAKVPNIDNFEVWTAT